MGKQPKQEPIKREVSHILLEREGVVSEITPLAMTFSLKDGHRLVYFDHAAGGQCTVSLEGCAFPLPGRQPEGLQTVDVSAEPVEGQG